MEELPAYILERISEDARPVVLRWWTDLTSPQRQTALGDWDQRRDKNFFTPQSGDGEEQIPVVIGGRFVPAEQPLLNSEWRGDYFEYLLKNPELLLTQELHRTFHLCRAHPEARAALAAGYIPAGFTCPFDSADCPMRRILAESPGDSFQLIGPIILPAKTSFQSISADA